MTQSAILGSLSTWRERNSLRPLAEVAREQAATLRQITGGSTGAPARTARRQAARERAQAFVARNAQPVTVAPVVHVATVADRRAEFAALDAMAAALPVGMYALPRRPEAGAGQSTYFFKIHPFRGGHRIVMLTGGVGAFVEHKMTAPYQRRALEGIAADIKGAAARFGHETGTCGRCSSPLTNDASRARGLGPHCAKQF